MSRQESLERGLDRQRRTFTSVLAGLAAWTFLLLVFATQYYVALRASGQPVTWTSQLRREFPGWALWAAVTPLIFFMARRAPLVPGKRIRNGLVHVLAAGVIFAIYLLLYDLVITIFPLRPDVTRAGLTFAERMSLSAQLNFATFILLYMAVLAVSYMLTYYGELQRQALRTAQLQGSLTQARLDALRMQLQPHFLFNTLHGISALMEEQPRRARRMISKLSELLRFSIDQSDELVPLAKEIEILRNYLEIQSMRFDERLHWSIDIPEACAVLPVPRFLLQPLVENSIQHGIGKRSVGGAIRVDARCEDRGLTLLVTDDGVGFPAATLDEGVGLTNTRARLAALYGDRARLELLNPPEGGARVEIHLPIRRSTANGG